jgi:hypothetical protein
MSIHPSDAVFMTFWLGLFGLIAILALWLGHDWIPAAMFPFGVAFIFGGISLQAFKAKRILTDVFSDSEDNPQTPRSLAP